MGLRAIKFGGTSLASASQIKKAVGIIKAQPDRRYLVASAPGKRSSDDIKITDLLYELYERRNGDYGPTLSAIQSRFTEIAQELGVDIDLDSIFAEIERQLLADAGMDYFASRGEYLNSMIIAAHLGWTFIDAAEVICFCEDGTFLSEETNMVLGEALDKVERAVVPGFYGATPSGVVRTFSRGGSDVTGALVARAAKVDVYENWTDVSGILMADPRIVQAPQPITRISYTALRQLTYLGASVLHENAIYPVRRAGIPTNIRNTDRPDDPGTWIQADAPGDQVTSSIAPKIIGLAGRTGCTAITVRKVQWSGSLGVGAGLLQLFDEANIAVDLVLTSVDAWTIIIRGDSKTLETVVAKIQTLEPDSYEVRDGLALVGVVTTGIVSRGTINANIADALLEAGIEIHVDSCADSMQVVVVDTSRYEDAVRAIYQALV
ncbi:MAG: aspartate kinase [Propionibacteriaceae bacterium]|nr:aspartate kinase [Propionibacteriaceae bacterium]